MRLVYHLYSCDIRYTAIIGPGFRIVHPIAIVIGGKVRIGRGFSIRQCTTIGGNSGKTRDYYGRQISQPIIKDNVTVGCNAVLIGPIEISNDVIIGASSIINKDISSSGIYAGNPLTKLS